MKKNVGSTDRIIRIILAIAIGYFAYSTTFETLWIQALLYVVAAIFLVTSISGFCPLYSIFKTNTYEAK
ncbi:MAG: DUF2892 domain-containing protein [Bacteroidetes bacterium]|nr:DUF2892 domain-containing protein [Bacteroidota bacterium]